MNGSASLREMQLIIWPLYGVHNDYIEHILEVCDHFVPQWHFSALGDVEEHKTHE